MLLAVPAETRRARFSSTTPLSRGLASLSPVFRGGQAEIYKLVSPPKLVTNLAVDHATYSGGHLATTSQDEARPLAAPESRGAESRGVRFPECL